MTITALPIIARPTAWQQRNPDLADDPTNMIVLPVIRIARYPDDEDIPGRRRRRAHRKRRSEHSGTSE